MGAAAVTATSGLPGEAIAQQVPFSSGTQPPKLKAPANSCDCHIHIFDKRFPASPHWKGQPVEDATVAAYRLFQKRVGTNRVVVVTPSTYGIDNRATLDGLSQLGASARGVAVVDLDIDDAELKQMAAQGVIGIRVNFVTPQSWGVTTAERLETMARRVNDLGWHVQIYATADQIVELEPVLARLPTHLVIDHLGRLPPDRGVDHPAYQVIRGLLDKGRTWVKLSGAYLNTKVGPPGYADATQMAQAYAKVAPERVVWGSDWNHRGEKELPDDALLFDLLLEWVPDDAARHRVLVENPAALYGFPKSG
jgi:predicted TIM-barrel fold metal-dependent hydrolase